MKKSHHGRSSKLLVPTLARSQPAAILKDENGQVVVHVSLASKGGNITDTRCYLRKRDETYRCSQSLQTGCRERETGYRQVERLLEAIFAGRELQGRITTLVRRINNSCWVYKNFNKISQNVQSIILKVGLSH